MRNACRNTIVGAVLFVVATVHSSDVVKNKDVDLDAFPWKPDGILPAPRELIPEAEYSVAKNEILKKIDKQYLLNPDYPSNGVLIHDIVPNSQATQAGVDENDVVIAIDAK